MTASASIYSSKDRTFASICHDESHTDTSTFFALVTSNLTLSNLDSQSHAIHTSQLEYPGNILPSNSGKDPNRNFVNLNPFISNAQLSINSRGFILYNEGTNTEDLLLQSYMQENLMNDHSYMNYIYHNSNKPWSNGIEGCAVIFQNVGKVIDLTTNSTANSQVAMLDNFGRWQSAILFLPNNEKCIFRTFRIASTDTNYLEDTLIISSRLSQIRHRMKHQ